MPYLKQHRSMAEVVASLHDFHNVDPQDTRMAWYDLELHNTPFFRAYNVMVAVKDQVAAFNFLVEHEIAVRRHLS